MLLDLRLPRVPGFEVLKWIRCQVNLEPFPIIVFTSSNQDGDVQQAYEFGADAYVVKPARPSQLLEIVRCIRDCWIDKTMLPPDCAHWESVNLKPSPMTHSITPLKEVFHLD